MSSAEDQNVVYSDLCESWNESKFSPHLGTFPFPRCWNKEQASLVKLESGKLAGSKEMAGREEHVETFSGNSRLLSNSRKYS